MIKRINRLNKNEFIALMAMLMSVTALTVDAMIPALGHMSDDLLVNDPNAIQLVISSVFFGISFGVLLYGPFADSFGRKKAIYLGVSIFLVGTLISIFATNLYVMVIGRIIQGFGSASCRVVTMAIIRDKYEGREMAKIMSLIMMVFIMVPALAPLLGQGILVFADWRAIFWFIFVFAVISLIWMHKRQRETLAPENVRVFSLRPIINGMIETVKNPITMGYTAASGIMFGAFVAYLNTAQQILQVQYNLGELFPFYFGLLALAYGFAAYMNAKLLNHFTMQQVCLYSLLLQVAFSIGFFVLSVNLGGNLPFDLFYIYLTANFICIGPLYGNFNSMALQPFGHMAGVATSVIASIQSLIAFFVGSFIGQMYDGSVQPLVGGYVFSGIAALFIFIGLQRIGRAKA